MSAPKSEITENPVVLRIVGLLEEQGKKDKELMDYLGVPQNMMSKWKYQDSTAYLKYVVEIAEFLNTSPNYLFLGNEKTKDIEGLTPMESEIILMLRQVDDGRRKCIRDTLRYFTENGGDAS